MTCFLEKCFKKQCIAYCRLLVVLQHSQLSSFTTGLNMIQNSVCRGKKQKDSKSVAQGLEQSTEVLLQLLSGDFQIFFNYCCCCCFKMKLLLIQWTCPLKHIPSAPTYTYMYVTKLSYMNTSPVPFKKQFWVQTNTTIRSEVRCAYIKVDQTLECDPDFIDTFPLASLLTLWTLSSRFFFLPTTCLAFKVFILNLIMKQTKIPGFHVV